MTCLFLGEDLLSKEKKISEVREKILQAPDAFKFDYDILYAHKLEPALLKETLLHLPAVGKQRFVIIKECHRLNPHNKELIADFTAKAVASTVLALDSDEMGGEDPFVKKLGREVKIFSFSKGKNLDVFSLTRVIAQKQKSEALKILSDLFAKGDHPLQIMGGLVWFWGKSRDKISQERFKKGLQDLQEADRNIKRTRLNPEHALEILIVKLCGREAG